METNICKFLPNRNRISEMNVVNLVYETRCPARQETQRLSAYRMHYITEGEGRLHTEQRTVRIAAGDVVLIPPTVSHSIENTGALKYMYISFLGVRANALAEQFRLGVTAQVYPGFETLVPLWRMLFEANPELTELCCEGVLLYTFSEIGKRIFVTEEQEKAYTVSQKVKHIIDDHFSNSDLTVKAIAEQLAYHPKYLSAAFKKEFHVGITDYIKTCRIQHACTLMEQGITSIKDLASLCGYSDPLYFSAVFKSRMGVSPREHRRGR